MPKDAMPTATAGTWTLGDLTVNRIGFGAKRLTGSGPFDLGRAADRERVIALLRRAIELGVNHIDTAAFYPTFAQAGQTSDLCWANDLIREALWPYPDDLVISTKAGPGYDASGDWHLMVRPDELRAQVEQNLRALGRDHLDLVNLRQTGLDSVTEHFGELSRLRDAGLIRHLGLSNIQPRLLAQAQVIAPVVCVQNRYGVGFGRVNDELLRTCGEQGIAFVPFFALAGAGRELGGVSQDAALAEVARQRGVSVAQVRIAWTLSRGAHVLAIPGTGDVGHLAENMAAGAIQLTGEELARLTKVVD
jgi:pyridoxine 4-dehydrogenase